MTTVTFQRTEEQQLLAQTARRFLQARAGSDVVRQLMMTPDAHDPELWRAAAEMGWQGLAVPEQFGGAGYGFAELAVVLEEQGRAVLPGPFLASAVLATSAILEGGTDDQRSRMLPPLASGEAIATLAVWERPTGLGADGVATTARRDGEGWVLDGTKRWVLNPTVADTVIVAARTGDGAEDVGLFVVEAGAAGVEVTATPTLDSTRKQGEVALSGVHVGADALLGDRPDAWDVVERVVALASVAIANEQVGVAQKCLEVSVEYAKTRFQFGRAIGSFQAVKHKVADMLVKVEHARSTATYAARVTEDRAELAIAAPLAKSICSDAAVWVSGETIQVHGGIGFTWEHDAHLWFKRAKSTSLLFGSAHEHRSLLADAVGL